MGRANEDRDGIADIFAGKASTSSEVALFNGLTLAQINDFFAFEPFVEDAKAALDFLRKQPEVDAKHVAIAGHSEGGEAIRINFRAAIAEALP